MKRVLEWKITKFMNESISYAFPPYSKRNYEHNLKHNWVSSDAIVKWKWKCLAKNFNFLGHWYFVSITNDLAISLIYHHWCLGLNVSVIWHEIQSFVGSSWILTSSSLLNVISTIAWVWESLAFGHNHWNWIDSNSIC